MEELNSNITSFTKDNFSINCNYNPAKGSIRISKKYKDNDINYNLNIYNDRESFNFEYDKTVDKLPYLNTSYYISKDKSNSIVMFDYPGINKNELCIINGEIDEKKHSLKFIIKENTNSHNIIQTYKNNILSISYSSLKEKLGIFIQTYPQLITQEDLGNNNIITQIILEISNRTLVYEKNNGEEIFYEILGIKENKKDYNTKVLYKNIDDNITDRFGNTILTGNYSLFNIFIKPYIDKINNYIDLIINNFPEIEKNLFMYDNILQKRGYDNYLFPNQDKDIKVKDVLRKIKFLQKDKGSV